MGIGVSFLDDRDAQGEKKPDRFQQAIDAAAMVDGSTGTDAYLEGWGWGKRAEREGSAQEVVDALVAELENEYTQERLREMIRERKVSS